MIGQVHARKIGGWMDLRADLGALEKIKISYLFTYETLRT